MNIFRLASLRLLIGTAVLCLSGCSTDDSVTPPEPCSLAIISPASAETMWLGDQSDIRWNHTGGTGEVRLRLAKAGAVVGEITETTPNDGYHPWMPTNMGAALGSDFSILVDTPGDAECASVSADFRLAECGLEIQTAAWPSQVAMGDTLLLFWHSTDTSGRVDIDLMKGGQVVGNIATNRADGGVMNWVVHTFNEGTSDAYIIRIRDHVVQGCETSSRLLGIRDDHVCGLAVSSPTQYQSVQVGQVLPIVWTGANTSGTVVLKLYDLDGFVGQIAAGVPVGQVRYDWTVSLMSATTPSSQYFIRVIDTVNPLCWNSSLGFLIRP